jgi:hypothetical protein
MSVENDRIFDGQGQMKEFVDLSEHSQLRPHNVGRRNIILVDESLSLHASSKGALSAYQAAWLKYYNQKQYNQILGHAYAR